MQFARQLMVRIPLQSFYVSIRRCDIRTSELRGFQIIPLPKRLYYRRAGLVCVVQSVPASYTLKTMQPSKEYQYPALCTNTRFSVIKSNQLLRYRLVIAVCSENHTEHINTLCGQNVEFMNVKLGGT